MHAAHHHQAALYHEVHEAMQAADPSALQSAITQLQKQAADAMQRYCWISVYLHTNVLFDVVTCA